MFHSSALAFGKMRERERFFAGEKVVAKLGPTGAFSIAVVLEVMGEGSYKVKHIESDIVTLVNTDYDEIKKLETRDRFSTDNFLGGLGWSTTDSESFYTRRSDKYSSPEKKTWKLQSPRYTNLHSLPKFQSPKKKSIFSHNFKDKKLNSPASYMNNDIEEYLKDLIASPVVGGYPKSPLNRAPGSRRSFMPSFPGPTQRSHLSPQKKFIAPAPFSLTPNRLKINNPLYGNTRENPNSYFPNTNDLSFGQRKERSKPMSTPSPLTWTGELPPKDANDNKYSRKVFLGGVPWDITNENLEETFSLFGSLTVEWPPFKNGQKPKGYVYIVFDDAISVNKLLKFCRGYSAKVFRDVSDGSMYKFHVRSQKMNSKEIQVIPWNLNDSTKVIGSQDKVNMHHQVFVGGLHGMLTATGLYKVMNDLFGNVVYVEIDIDKYKYPLGSGRVNFSSLESYHRAIQEKYVQVKCMSPKVDKRIQIDPYIRENENCSECEYPGPVYCRMCLDYFCEDCWDWHMRDSSVKHERVCRTRNGKIE